MTQPIHDDEPAPADAAEPIASTLEETAGEVTANADTINESTLNTDTPAPFGGAPCGNANALTHGLDSDPAVGQRRLKMGKLPSGLARIEREANRFRRMLENAVVSLYGVVDVDAMLAIDEATKWHRHSDLALRWLRDNHDRLSPTERLTFSREISKAAGERAKAVARLKLAASERDEMDLAMQIVQMQLSAQSGQAPAIIHYPQGQ